MNPSWTLLLIMTINIHRKDYLPPVFLSSISFNIQKNKFIWSGNNPKSGRVKTNEVIVYRVMMYANPLLIV